MGKSKGKGRKGKPKRTEAPPSQAINNFLTEAGPVRYICLLAVPRLMSAAANACMTI
jgi:hypothetical protein